MPPLSLSVVIPCYNPPSGWDAKLKSVIEQLSSLTPEIIIVNDGSTTGFSAKQLETIPTLKIVSYTTNMGKGYALRQGVKAANGELIIYTDVDFPYTQDSFMRVLTALKQGSDVAIGVRGSSYYTHLPASRVWISKFLRSLIRLFLRIPTDDTQCGLKGFNKKGKEVFLQTTINRYLFDLEFVFLSSRSKLSIQPVEVDLRPEVVLSSMKMKILFQEFRNFLRVLLHSLQ